MSNNNTNTESMSRFSLVMMTAIMLVGTFACVISQMLLTTGLPKIISAFNVSTSTA